MHFRKRPMSGTTEAWEQPSEIGLVATSVAPSGPQVDGAIEIHLAFLACVKEADSCRGVPLPCVARCQAASSRGDPQKDGPGSHMRSKMHASHPSQGGRLRNRRPHELVRCAGVGHNYALLMRADNAAHWRGRSNARHLARHEHRPTPPLPRPPRPHRHRRTRRRQGRAGGARAPHWTNVYVLAELKADASSGVRASTNAAR